MALIINTNKPERVDALRPDQRHWVYNGLDVCITAQVKLGIEARMDDTARATYAQAIAWQAPILSMMFNGLDVDIANRDRLMKRLRADQARLTDHLNRLIVEGMGIDMPINPRSPTQVKMLLYNVMKLPARKKRNTNGAYTESADREILESLSAQHFFAEPIIAHILAIRDISKSLGFLKTPLDEDGRIRCNFSLAGTNTGRLSSQVSDFGTGTNLQNVDKQLRYMFVAPKGRKFVNIDLEQADARNVGAIAWNFFLESHGPEFAGAFLDATESGDLHTLVCRMAWPELAWPEAREDWRAVAEQLAYRGDTYRQLAKKLGHGCLTSDHEVLTPTGWVPITTQPAHIMQWDNQQSTWAAVSHWEAHPYTGLLQSFEGTSISALMTHDHRVPFKKDNNSPHVYEAPAKNGPQKIMPLGGGFMGGTQQVHGALIAAVMSDAELTGNKARFNLTKPRKIARLKKICAEAKVECVKQSNGRWSINFTHAKVAGAYMLNWTAKSAQDFLREYAYWAGHHAPTSTTLFSVNPKHLQWIQTLGRLYGIGGNMQLPQVSGFSSITYRLQQNARKYASRASVKWTSKPVVKEMVYCPTVPTGWFYVRRKGKIFVTGNTNYLGQPATMAMHTKGQRSMIEAFQENYFAAFPCVKAWQNETIRLLQATGTLTNLFGRRRMFFGRRTDQPVINAAIAYSPQGSTGEEINHGINNLWRGDKAKWFRLHVQVHDSILLSIPEEAEDELVPLVLKKMEVHLPLAGGRDFFVPLDAQTGWNYGYAGKGNVNGLAGWKGHDPRVSPHKYAPKPLSFRDAL